MVGGDSGSVGRVGFPFNTLSYIEGMVTFCIKSSQLLQPICCLAEIRAHDLTVLTAAYIPWEIPSQKIPPVVGIGPIMCRARRLKGSLCADVTWKQCV